MTEAPHYSIYTIDITWSELSSQFSPQQTPHSNHWDSPLSYYWDQLLRVGPEAFQSTAAASKLCLKTKCCGTLSTMKYWKCFTASGYFRPQCIVLFPLNILVFYIQGSCCSKTRRLYFIIYLVLFTQLEVCSIYYYNYKKFTKEKHERMK